MGLKCETISIRRFQPGEGPSSIIVKSSWTFGYPSFQALMEMVSESVEMTVELHSVISYHLPGDVYI